VHRTGWLSSCRCKSLRWLVSDKASSRQVASAGWHDASREEGLRALKSARARSRRKKLQHAGKAKPLATPALRPSRQWKFRRVPRFGGKLRRAALIRRYGMLADGLSSPDRRSAEVLGPGRARQTRPRTDMAQQRRGRLDRIAKPTPPGNATGRGASRRSPGLDTPSGGSAGRVGGLDAACCSGIT